MAKFEKGRAKTGGRQKGTPNKQKPIVREMLTKITNTPDFWDRFSSELFSLEGREFTHAAKEIFDVIEPKLQAITAEVTSSDETSPILNRLKELSEIADD